MSENADLKQSRSDSQFTDADYAEAGAASKVKGGSIEWSGPTKEYLTKRGLIVIENYNTAPPGVSVKFTISRLSPGNDEID